MTRTHEAAPVQAARLRRQAPRHPALRRPADATLRRVASLAALAVAAALPLSSMAHAAPPSLQFATSNIELPVMPPSQDTATGPLDTTVPLYERAPMPNQNAFAPSDGAGAPSDPVQPSVISRSSKVGESDGYSRSSSASATQEGRMKPGLGFALHVPTE